MRAGWKCFGRQKERLRNRIAIGASFAAGSIRSIVSIVISSMIALNSNAFESPGQSNSESGFSGKSRSVRVAAISFEPQKMDLRANASRLVEAFEKAAAGGALLAVAPEGILEGYIVNEIIAGKIPVERMREVAIPIDHEIIRKFRELADRLNLCIVFGFAETVGDDIYNTAIFIDDAGVIRGKYHKMQLAEGCHPDWWFDRLGTEARAFDTPFGRCGILICNDRWNPLLARILKADGAQFLAIPSFGSTSRAQDEAVLARSNETGIPVIEANVGVTLIASSGKIVALDREKSTISWGEIEIPPVDTIDLSERDRLEIRFLRERMREMPKRYRQTMEKLKKTGAQKPPECLPNVAEVGPDR